MDFKNLQRDLFGRRLDRYRQRKLVYILRSFSRTRSADLKRTYPTALVLRELFVEQLGPLFLPLPWQWRFEFFSDVMDAAGTCVHGKPKLFMPWSTDVEQLQTAIKFLKTELEQKTRRLNTPYLRNLPHYVSRESTKLSVLRDVVKSEKSKVTTALQISEEDLLRADIYDVQYSIDSLERDLAKLTEKPRKMDSFRSGLLGIYLKVGLAKEIGNHKIRVFYPRGVKVPNKSGLYPFSFARFALNILYAFGKAMTETDLLFHQSKISLPPSNILKMYRRVYSMSWERYVHEQEQIFDEAEHDRWIDEANARRAAEEREIYDHLAD